MECAVAAIRPRCQVAQVMRSRIATEAPARDGQRESRIGGGCRDCRLSGDAACRRWILLRVAELRPTRHGLWRNGSTGTTEGRLVNRQPRSVRMPMSGRSWRYCILHHLHTCSQPVVSPWSPRLGAAISSVTSLLLAVVCFFHVEFLNDGKAEIGDIIHRRQFRRPRWHRGADGDPGAGRLRGKFVLALIFLRTRVLRLVGQR